MHKFLLLTCSICFMSMVALADEIVETCADGGGTIVIGAVSGHKYCRSNKGMTWWNTNSWCDSLGKQAINLNDCYRNPTTPSGHCPEFALGGDGIEVWTNTFFQKGWQTHVILINTGRIRNGTDGELLRYHNRAAVCK